MKLVILLHFLAVRFIFHHQSSFSCVASTVSCRAISQIAHLSLSMKLFSFMLFFSCFFSFWVSAACAIFTLTPFPPNPFACVGNIRVFVDRFQTIFVFFVVSPCACCRTMRRVRPQDLVRVPAIVCSHRRQPMAGVGCSITYLIFFRFNCIVLLAFII